MPLKRVSGQRPVKALILVDVGNQGLELACGRAPKHGRWR
jgi:hypothetical protein